jgi:hypothetical protein
VTADNRSVPGIRDPAVTRRAQKVGPLAEQFE